MSLRGSGVNAQDTGRPARDGSADGNGDASRCITALLKSVCQEDADGLAAAQQGGSCLYGSEDGSPQQAGSGDSSADGNGGASQRFVALPHSVLDEESDWLTPAQHVAPVSTDYWPPPPASCGAQHRSGA